MKVLKLKTIDAKIRIRIMSVLIIMGVSIMIVVGYNTNAILYNQVHKQINDNVRNVIYLSDKMYPGEWNLNGENLYKGKKLINESKELVDSIGNSLGITIMIFVRENQILTNMNENGKLILGTKAPDIIKDTVLIKGNEYIGEVQINGKNYEGIYIPLQDSDKNIVGMFFSGVEKASIDADFCSHMNTVLAFVVIILIICMIMSELVFRKISKNIRSLATSMVLVGEGDFTVKNNIKSGDEMQVLAETVNKMTQRLGKLVAKIIKTSMELSNSSSTLTASSQETVAITEEIVTAINNIVEVLIEQSDKTSEGLNKTNELSENIEEVASFINDVILMFNSAKNLNNEGLKVIELLSDATKKSDSASLKVGKAITDMDSSSQKIGEVINTITQITNQTKLLALNASIEAASAGDAGRGFSVVASEIKKLAEESDLASSEIKNIIKGIQAQSKRAVAEMNATELLRIAQDEAVNETGAIFGKTLETISNLWEKVSEIDEMNKEMVCHKDNILVFMRNISQKSDEISAVTEEISASAQVQLSGMKEVTRTSEELNDIVEELNSEIEYFKI